MPGGRASISFDQSVYGRQMRSGFGTDLPVQTSSVAPNVQYVEFKGDGLSRGFGSSSSGNAFSRASQSAQAAQQSAQAAEVKQGADAIAKDREDAAAAAAAAREERRKALMSAGLDLHRTFTSLPSENVPQGGAQMYGAAFMDSIAGFGNAMGDGRGWGDLVVANADSSVKTGWNDENGTFDFVYWNANERRPGISPYHVIRITPEELRGRLESAGLVESKDTEEKAAREKWDAAHAASIAEVTKLLGTQNISDENKAALNARLATLLGETYQSPSENGPQTVPASFFAEGNPTAFRHLFPTEARRRTAEKNKENTGGVFVGGENKSLNNGESGVLVGGEKWNGGSTLTPEQKADQEKRRKSLKAERDAAAESDKTENLFMTGADRHSESLKDSIDLVQSMSPEARVRVAEAMLDGKAGNMTVDPRLTGKDEVTGEDRREVAFAKQEWDFYKRFRPVWDSLSDEERANLVEYGGRDAKGNFKNQRTFLLRQAPFVQDWLVEQGMSSEPGFDVNDANALADSKNDTENRLTDEELDRARRENGGRFSPLDMRRMLVAYNKGGAMHDPLRAKDAHWENMFRLSGADREEYEKYMLGTTYSVDENGSLVAGSKKNGR